MAHKCSALTFWHIHSSLVLVRDRQKCLLKGDNYTFHRGMLGMQHQNIDWGLILKHTVWVKQPVISKNVWFWSDNVTGILPIKSVLPDDSWKVNISRWRCSLFLKGLVVPPNWKSHTPIFFLKNSNASSVLQ